MTAIDKGTHDHMRSSNENRVFAAICYLTLMDHHGAGWKEEAHPGYILEKLKILNGDPGYVMNTLDSDNQQCVLAYHRLWNLELPAVVKEWAERVGYV